MLLVATFPDTQDCTEVNESDGSVVISLVTSFIVSSICCFALSSNRLLLLKITMEFDTKADSAY